MLPFSILPWVTVRMVPPLIRTSLWKTGRGCCSLVCCAKARALSKHKNDNSIAQTKRERRAIGKTPVKGKMKNSRFYESYSQLAIRIAELHFIPAAAASQQRSAISQTEIVLRT